MTFYLSKPLSRVIKRTLPKGCSESLKLDDSNPSQVLLPVWIGICRVTPVIGSPLRLVLMFCLSVIIRGYDSIAYLEQSHGFNSVLLIQCKPVIYPGRKD